MNVIKTMNILALMLTDRTVQQFHNSLTHIGFKQKLTVSL